MTKKNVRTLRTILQIVIGIASAIPTLVAGLNLGAAGVQVVVVAAFVTREFHLIEQIPGFPESLKID